MFTCTQNWKYDSSYCYRSIRRYQNSHFVYDFHFEKFAMLPKAWNVFLYAENPFWHVFPTCSPNLCWQTWTADTLYPPLLFVPAGPSDSFPLIFLITTSSFVHPSPPGWCRWAKSSAAASQKSCRSPSSGRVSTTSNTTTGWFDGPYVVVTQQHTEHLNGTCLVSWETTGNEASAWTAGYHRFTETFHHRSRAPPWSCSIPPFWGDTQLGGNAQPAGSTFSPWLHNPHCRPAAWICMPPRWHTILRWFALMAVVSADQKSRIRFLNIRILGSPVAVTQNGGLGFIRRTQTGVRRGDDRSWKRR